MSTIFGTCSIMTGHASMQARQVVQSQRTASVMTSPTSWSDDVGSALAAAGAVVPLVPVPLAAPFAPAAGDGSVPGATFVRSTEPVSVTLPVASESSPRARLTRA